MGLVVVVPLWCYGAVLVPSLNVRLSESAHAVLKEAAVVNRRSLQQEVLHRLFPPIEVQVSGDGLGLVSPSPLPVPPDLAVGAKDDVSEPVIQVRGGSSRDLVQRLTCQKWVARGEECSWCGQVHK